MGMGYGGDGYYGGYRDGDGANMYIPISILTPT